MSDTARKLKKRRAFPVPLPNDETIYVSMIPFKFHDRMSAITNPIAKIGFSMGISFVDKEGVREFSQGEDETDVDFGMRVLEETDLDPDYAGLIRDAITKINIVPKQEVLLKNSEETSTSS